VSVMDAGFAHRFRAGQASGVFGNTALGRAEQRNTRRSSRRDLTSRSTVVEMFSRRRHRLLVGTRAHGGAHPLAFWSRRASVWFETFATSLMRTGAIHGLAAPAPPERVATGAAAPHGRWEHAVRVGNRCKPSRYERRLWSELEHEIGKCDGRVPVKAGPADSRAGRLLDDQTDMRRIQRGRPAGR
jgi:hypothetical protein